MIDNVILMLLLSQLGLRMAELGNTQSNKVYLKLHWAKENMLNYLRHTKSLLLQNQDWPYLILPTQGLCVMQGAHLLYVM